MGVGIQIYYVISNCESTAEYFINRVELILQARLAVLIHCDLIYCSVRKQVVNVPSYIVRLDSQKHIDFSLRSPYGGGRPGKSNEEYIPKQGVTTSQVKCGHGWL